MGIRRFCPLFRSRGRLTWVICACVAAIAGCGQPRTDAPDSSASADLPVIRAEVLTVRSRDWPTLVHVSGSLFADENAVVGAKVAGRVSDVRVDLGDAVDANEALAALDLAEFELQVAQAEAQLEQARAAVGLSADDSVDSLNPEDAPPVREARAVWDDAKTKNERWSRLRKSDAVAIADAQAAIAAEEVAAAQYASALNSVREKIALIRVRTAELALARQRLADAVIPAPFDGLVVERQVAPGSFVQIGDPIATIVRTDPLHFRGMVSERFARRLAVGQEVMLHVESIDQPRTAQVTRISPTLDPLSRSLLFEAELPNPNGELRTGLFAEGDVTLDAESQAIVVPISTVIEFAGVEKVWAVMDGKTDERVVLTGERRDGMVEILEGVSRGDVLLIDASQGKAARVEVTESVPVTDPSLTQSTSQSDNNAGAASAGAN